VHGERQRLHLAGLVEVLLLDGIEHRGQLPPRGGAAQRRALRCGHVGFEPEELLARDGWTVRTADGSMSAHVEHTIVVRDGAPRVLTA
jgi:hypothetical protein